MPYRFYMVVGDIYSPGVAIRAVPAEPEAIFCTSAGQHHEGWLRLTASAIHGRIARHDYTDIRLEEYERALAGIDGHRSWQAAVMRRKGYTDPRPRVKRARTTAIKPEAASPSVPHGVSC